MTSKLHLRIEITFYRQYLATEVSVIHKGQTQLKIRGGQTVPKGEPELLVTVKNILVRTEDEIHKYAMEWILVNRHGAWQTPAPCDFLYKVHRFGWERASVREKLDGTDGENGAARRRGILPKTGVEQ